MAMKPLVGLSLDVEPDFVEAAYPLFESEEVEILEWSMDVGWGLGSPPDWLESLLEIYSREGRLLGHGVTFSVLSAELTPRQQSWLESLRGEMRRRKFRHLTEHFGFLSAGNFHEGAPLPVPLSEASLRAGQENLCLLAEAAGCPIGLENLAFAFGPREVWEQGAFIERLLEPVDGFVLLDLHNIYCQVCNFGVEPRELLESYPLHLAREIHVSGGSWKDEIRRDTHDGAVPEEVFHLVELGLELCPNVEAVIFERLGGTLGDEGERGQFRADFRRLKAVVGNG